MDFKLKDCLFIGIDMQRVFASMAPGRSTAIKQIEQLRTRLAAVAAPCWQVAMCPEPVPAYVTGDVRMREEAKRARDHELLFPPAASESLFWKQASRKPSGQYLQLLQSRRPQAVIVYGWFLDECVYATAAQARKLLPKASQVVVLRDCGAQRTASVDLAEVYSGKASLLDSQAVAITDDTVTFTGVTPLARLTPTTPVAASRPWAPPAGKPGSCRR